MAKLMTEIKLTGLPKLKDFLDVVADCYDELPESIQNAVLELIKNDDVTAYNVEYLASLRVDHHEVKAYVDGVESEHVESGHRINKKVFMGGNFIVAASFWIVHKGQFICGWGEKPSLEAK